MPSAYSHSTQVEHNNNLLDEAVFNIKDTDYSDWFITISFYVVIHLIEESLADKYNQHPENHKQRNTLIKNKDFFKTIRGKYYTLYQASRKSRYKGFKFTKDYMEHASDIIDEIDEHIHN